MYYSGGLTYSSHPVSLAAALATIGVYEEDGLIENAARLDPVMREHHRRLAAKHPSVGATRNLGLFGILDLVRSRDPWTPLTPFNGTSDEMKAIGKFFRDNGLYTMIANNSIHTNPPLCITEEQLAEGFEIIDRGPRHRRPGGDRLADDRRPDRHLVHVDRDRAGGRGRPGAPGVHSRRRRVATLVGVRDRASSSLWEAVKCPRRRPVAVPGRPRHRPRRSTISPPFRFPFASDLNLPHWFNILGRPGRPRAAQRAAVARGVPGRRRALHLARGGHRLRGRRAARARAGDALRPLAAGSSGRSCPT